MITYRVLDVETAKKFCVFKYANKEHGETIHIFNGLRTYESYHDVKLCVMSVDAGLRPCILVPGADDCILLSSREIMSVISLEDLQCNFERRA